MLGHASVGADLALGREGARLTLAVLVAALGDRKSGAIKVPDGNFAVDFLQQLSGAARSARLYPLRLDGGKGRLDFANRDAWLRVVASGWGEVADNSVSADAAPCLYPPPQAVECLLALKDTSQQLLRSGPVLRKRQIRNPPYRCAYAVENGGGEKRKKTQSLKWNADVKLADEYDAAQPEGASKGGRPKTVGSSNGFTAAAAGVSRYQVHEARKVREAAGNLRGLLRYLSGATPMSA
jgi:hypothetical protein